MAGNKKEMAHEKKEAEAVIKEESSSTGGQRMCGGGGNVGPEEEWLVGWEIAGVMAAARTNPNLQQH